MQFHGQLADRPLLAANLAAADVVLAPCLVETFGLSVLEALACGTPVVAASGGASGELLGGAAGAVAAPTASGMAAGVLEVLTRPEAVRRAAARARAERHPWSRSIAEMLDVHEHVAAKSKTSSDPQSKRTKSKTAKSKTAKSKTAKSTSAKPKAARSRRDAQAA